MSRYAEKQKRHTCRVQLVYCSRCNQKSEPQKQAFDDHSWKDFGFTRVLRDEQEVLICKDCSELRELFEEAFWYQHEYRFQPRTEY